MRELWKRNLPVPFFSQRANKYIWKRIAKSPGGEDYKGKHYNPNEIIQEVSLAWGSCNITSLCMILHYFGITDDTPDEMMRKFYEDFRPEWAREAYTKNSGRYRQKPGPNRLDYGENCIIHKDYFARVIGSPYLHGALVIRYRNYWSFPVSQKKKYIGIIIRGRIFVLSRFGFYNTLTMNEKGKL